MERIEAMKVIYEWFCKNELVTKDHFLSHRELWDGLQREFMNAEMNYQHDEIKRLVAHCDKAGYLGGRSAGLLFEEQHEIVETRNRNRKETGDADGAGGVKRRIATWAEAMAEELKEYETTPWWSNRSKLYRASVKWRCELCHRQHPTGSGSLVAHHITYKFPDPDGSEVFHRETDDVLMAVCKTPCHQLADIARYLSAGRLTQAEIDRAIQPLFAGLR